MAIAREKQIKGYSRLKKRELINRFNGDWNDLYTNGAVRVPL
jgi:putative endonuclease